MLDKNSFFIIGEKEKETGNYLYHAVKVPNNYNLHNFFHPYKGFEIISINACGTWKDAQYLADFWNDCAKNNGNYAL